jgi:purine-binding chemotaxis protein CheW
MILDESGRAEWLLCRAGALLCAIPIEHVIETMRVLPVEPVTGAPRYVLGLSLIRGAPVPVVDTGLLVGEQPTRPERLVTVKTGDHTIALATEAVLGIVPIASREVGALPPLLRDAAADTVATIGTRDAELLFFLRAARLVPGEMLDRLAFAGALA